MESLIYTGLLSLLWVANLFHGTGLDSVYHITDLTKGIVILLFAVSVIRGYARTHAMLVDKKKFYIYGIMGLIFIVSPLIHGYGTAGIDYLWVFCLVYLLSKLRIDDRTMFWTGLIYGILGCAILYIFNFGTVLNGWNANSIAMIGMNSFLVLLVPFFREQRLRNKVILLVASGIIATLMIPTNSRSSILFTFIGTLFAIGLLPRAAVSRNYSRTLFCLVLPLIIAVFVMIVSNSSVMDGLNEWSYEQYNKPLFNGRDELWKNGFEILWQNPLFGNGNLIAASWHNSAVTCLVSTGVLGFVFWILSFGEVLGSARPYLNDYIVIGCFVSFIVLYVQQSVELGFISGSPTFIGYILLGLLLGRVRFLKEMEDYESY